MTDFSRVKQNLEARGFRVSVFATAAEAADYLDSAIDNTSVGFGGSVTLEQMGLYERPERHDRVNWHWRPTVDGADARQAAMTAEYVYHLCKRLAETGELINIDGNGNRVASPCTATRRSGSSWDGTSWPPPTRRPFGGRGTLLRRRMPSGWAGKRPAPFMEIAAMTARARSGSAGAWWFCGRP